jgi:hypothetical protein
MHIHYNAFISYRHHPDDIRVAHQIHRALERFYIPKAIRKKRQEKGSLHLFRDKEELPITSNLNDDIDEALRNYAQMTEATYEEVCEQMLFKGDNENFISDAGYRENTDFVIYAFYWQEGELEAKDIYVTEFRTPAHVDSTESVAITFSGIDPYEMSVTCTPTTGVERYYYYFAETSKVEAMLAELDESEDVQAVYHNVANA